MTTLAIGAFATAGEMLAALRDGVISAEELLDLHLSRAERYNPALNALVSPNHDEARAAARAADAERVRGEGGALAGLPLTIKDSIDVCGLPTTSGLVDRATTCPEHDSPLAARVRAAGAAIMAKTNVPPLTSDWQANNPVFGRTVNPWDAGRTPGGSTGGGAAAVAAGLTPLEFGSDIGGSIRVPAAFCGVYGHRPSETALARSGHFPGSPTPNPPMAMGVQGPLARSAEDLELALDVVSGAEPGEDAAWSLRIPPARRDDLAGFRVAVLPVPDWLPLDGEVAAALDRLASGLERRGARVARALPEGFGDLREHHALYTSLLTVMVTLGMPPVAREKAATRSRASGDPFGAARADGLVASAAGYVTMFSRRERYRAAYRAFFREWDVLLAPAFGRTAFPHIDPETAWEARALQIDGSPTAFGLQLGYPGLATLSGQPATAFPAGRAADGLPIGLQAVGPYLEDRTPIRFAALVAREFGGFTPPPGYE